MGIRRMGRGEKVRLDLDRGEQVMEEGALIDLIDEAIHTDGEQLSDEQVLDYIEQLLKKRGSN